MIIQRDLNRYSEFEVTIVKYLADGTPIVTYKAQEPAEYYTLPNCIVEATNEPAN